MKKLAIILALVTGFSVLVLADEPAEVEKVEQQRNPVISIQGQFEEKSDYVALEFLASKPLKGEVRYRGDSETFWRLAPQVYDVVTKKYVYLAFSIKRAKTEDRYDILVTGLTQDGEKRFVDRVKFGLNADGDEIESSVSTADDVKYEERSQEEQLLRGLTREEIFNGHPQLPPQIVAQAQANYMASTGDFRILGRGFVQTSQGRLAAGLGMGYGQLLPSTASDPRGSAPVADAMARGKNGAIYRVRLYASESTR